MNEIQIQIEEIRTYNSAFVNDTSFWLARETGAPLVVHTPEEQLAALLEYATLIDSPLKERIKKTIQKLSNN